MKSLVGYLRSIGWLIVAFVLLVTLSVSALTATLAPRIVAPNFQATTQIPLSLLSGSHASYEASTYAADFATAVALPGASASAATASGQDGTDVSRFLTAEHAGDTTYSTATFSAPSESGATAGLRAAVSSALQEMTTRARERAEMELTAATTARVQLLRDQSANGLPPEGADPGLWQATREADRTQANERAAQAQAGLADAQVSERSVAQVVQGLEVSALQLSTRSDQLRMVIAAGLSALLFTTGVAALVKWVTVRRSPGPTARPPAETPAEPPAEPPATSPAETPAAPSGR